MVNVDRGLDGVDADLVRIDHELGAYLATRHLLELGHRDIAFIGGPADTSVAQMRLAGYCRALKEAGIERSEEHTSELQSLMRLSYAVFCLKKKKQTMKQSHRL